ncbi:MAG: hypothetical protein GF411_17315 [Candidatus Lokiarchaeota archaeon]|nr:hypothetical protein [Candidatus Lokiarchaeota archaeon]
MAQSVKLLELYKQLLNEPFRAMPENDDLESVQILYETEWVRIYVVRSEEAPHCASIEVETSLPLCASKTTKDCGDFQMDARDLLDGMIIHLQYMTALCEQGFTADVVGPDCLWTVSKEFINEPSENIFKLLCPPTMSF